MQKMSEEDFLATVDRPVRADPSAEPPLALWTYLNGLPRRLEGHQFQHGAVCATYQMAAGPWQHSLIRSAEAPQVYLAVVHDPIARTVLGHRVLDMDDVHGFIGT